jgi:FAD/FMN-containing dehydrogenase
VIAGGDPHQPPTVNVYGAVLVSDRELSGLVDDLVRRVGADPMWRWGEVLPFPETRQFWAQLPPPGTPYRDLGPPTDGVEHPWLVVRSEFFRQALPAQAVARLLAGLDDGRPPGQERELDFMPWGGAYNRVPADATAFVHRGELFQLKHSATVDPAASTVSKDAAVAFVRQSWDTVRPWGSGGVFPAFPDRDLSNPAEAYYGTNLARLRQVKTRYDPTDVFRPPAGQGVAP